MEGWVILESLILKKYEQKKLARPNSVFDSKLDQIHKGRYGFNRPAYLVEMRSDKTNTTSRAHDLIDDVEPANDHLAVG